MALQKTKELPSGVSGNYWKVVHLQFNTLTETSEVVLCLFKDKAARDAGKEPLLNERFSWSGEDFPFTVAAMTEDEPITLAYTKIKESNMVDEAEQNWFANATDV